MSSLWPELLRITLCPDQVVLERGKLIITLDGMEPRYLEPEIIPVEPQHEPTLWTAPLAVLGIALDGLPEGPHDAIVILSNHFVDYPLLQAATPDQLNNAGEVIEQPLQAAIAELLQQHDCRLTSLLPRLVAFGPSLQDELQGESGWLVLVEEGLASIGLALDGELTHFRNFHMWPASSSVGLLTLLDQEAFRAGLRMPPRNLLLWRRDESEEIIMPPNAASWQITRLGDLPEGGAPYREVSQQTLLIGARA
ncbi:MAG: hypothetical protein H6R10_575 [Rhodocyclaceae bacterium]|nr:hypothetical protein [Rhodocyclaceae bacterium]